LFFLLLQFCWRQNIRDNKEDIAFFLVWDKDSYTERFLALLSCTCVLQPEFIHLYQTSSLLPGHLPMVASASLRLLYSLLYSGHINHSFYIYFQHIVTMRWRSTHEVLWECRIGDKLPRQTKDKDQLWLIYDTV
jgi:hypothetical protein